jgi:hypothetical protein
VAKTRVQSSSRFNGFIGPETVETVFCEAGSLEPPEVLMRLEKLFVAIPIIWQNLPNQNSASGRLNELTGCNQAH